MLSMLVLFVLLLIVFQISISTGTGARVTRNENSLKAMDLAIESTLLQVFEDLRMDGEADASAGGDSGLGAAGGDGGGGGALDGMDEGGGESSSPSDSREDEWATPRRTEMNDIRLRIFIQDEDSKFNLFSILTENEDEAEKAMERLVRILDFARGGTRVDIDSSDAETMAREILEFMQQRDDQMLPRPEVLTDNEEFPERGLPFSLREFIALESFNEDHFRDFRDENGDIVHSLGSFLTVWTSIELEDGSESDPFGVGGQGDDEEDDEEEDDEEEDGGRDGGGDGEGGQGGDFGDGGAGPGGGGGGSSGGDAGVAVNVNTAAPAVLKALLDDRDVPYDFWDEVIEYRNTEDEEVEDNEDPPLDEFGEPITVNKFFGSVDELSEVDGWNELEPLTQGELQQLLTVQSSVFSIYLTARRPTGFEGDRPAQADRWDLLQEDENGQGLVRTVRCVVWRRILDDGTVDLIPLQRWEVIDYVPFEIFDYPDDRPRAR